MIKEQLVQYLKEHSLFDGQFSPFTVDTLQDSYPPRMNIPLDSAATAAKAQSVSFVIVVNPKITLLVALRNTLRQLDLKVLSDDMALEYLRFLEVMQGKVVHQIFPLLQRVIGSKRATSDALTIQRLAEAIFENLNEKSLLTAGQDQQLIESGVKDDSKQGVSRLELLRAQIASCLAALSNFDKKFSGATENNDKFLIAKDLLEQYPDLPCLKPWGRLIILLKERTQIESDLDWNSKKFKEVFQEVVLHVRDDEKRQELISNFEKSMQGLQEQKEKSRVYREKELGVCQQELDSLILPSVLDEVLAGLAEHKLMVAKKLELLTEMCDSVPAVSEYIEDLIRRQNMAEESSLQLQETTGALEPVDAKRKSKTFYLKNSTADSGHLPLFWSDCSGAPKPPIEVNQDDRREFGCEAFFAFDEEFTGQQSHNNPEEKKTGLKKLFS